MPLINEPVKTLFLILSVKPIELDITNSGADHIELAAQKAAARAHTNTDI
jgi:hypothetical protein